MKKLVFLFSIVAVFLLLPIAALAQTELPPLPVTFNVETYVSTFLLFASSVVFLTGLVNKHLKIPGNWKQFVSFILALILGFVAFFMHLGIFEGVPWWYVIILSVCCGLGANGLYDWALIQTILKGIKIIPKTPPKA